MRRIRSGKLCIGENELIGWIGNGCAGPCPCGWRRAASFSCGAFSVSCRLLVLVPNNTLTHVIVRAGLSSYSHYAAPEPLEVCVSVCDDVHSASACEKVIGYVTTTLMRTESPFYDLLVDCKAWPALNCTAGGDTYSYFAADNAVCPEPLLPTRPGMQDASELVEPSLLGIADCNAACPSNIYVNSEWEVLSDGLQGAVWLSLVASLLVGVFQTWQGEKLQLLSGLPAATSLLSAVAIIELFANGYERVYCEDDVYVVEDDEACVMQSALTLFCATSTAAIVVCQAHSAYIRLDKTRKQASTPWLNVLYVLLIAVIPALYVAYAYQSDWLGFDKHQELPFCTLTYDTSSTFANLDLRLFGTCLEASTSCRSAPVADLLFHRRPLVAHRPTNDRTVCLLLHAQCDDYTASRIYMRDPGPHLTHWRDHDANASQPRSTVVCKLQADLAARHTHPHHATRHAIFHVRAPACSFAWLDVQVSHFSFLILTLPTQIYRHVHHRLRLLARCCCAVPPRARCRGQPRDGVVRMHFDDDCAGPGRGCRSRGVRRPSQSCLDPRAARLHDAILWRSGHFAGACVPARGVPHLHRGVSPEPQL